MATTPDRLKAETEQARDKLAADVDRLADRASPKRKLKQGSERLRDAVRTARDKAAGGLGGSADETGQAAEKLRSLSDQAWRTAKSHPLATAMVAGFGAGFFAARLVPRRRP